MMFSYKAMLSSLLPKGAIWQFKKDGNFSKLLDGIADAVEPVVASIKQIASMRDPDNTPALSDLEREYGTLPDDTQTEESRRQALAAKVYAAPDWGPEALERRLHAAGFTDLRVYRNEDRIDPRFYTRSGWAMTLNNKYSILGHKDAYLGRTGRGAKILANGETFTPGETTPITYTIPSDPDLWHLVFFVGGELDVPAVGWLLIVDGDMEAATTDAWTAGNGAFLTKDTDSPAEGSQSLKITGTTYTKQDAGINVRDPDALAVLRMADNGDNVLYEIGTTQLHGENGTDYTNPALAPGDVATDATALEFDGTTQGAKLEGLVTGSEGSMSAWVKPASGGRETTFRLRPTQSGYSALGDYELEGESIAAEIQLIGEDATTSAWGTLAIAGTGDDPDFTELTPGVDNVAVEFQGAKYYEAASASVGQIGTDDVVLELIWRHVDETASLVSKYVGAGDHMELYTTSGGNALCASLNGISITGSVTLVEGCWYRGALYVDRSGNMRLYVNHTSAGTVDVSAQVAADPGSTAELAIGARTGGTQLSSAAIAYVGLFKGDALLTTDEQTDVELRRAAMTYGVRPTVWQWRDNPTSVADLDAEAADASAWTASQASLSKQAGARTDGTGSLVLRITGDTSNADGYASQASKLATGAEYRIQGWARGDGASATPAILAGDGATAVWTGTTSATWQSFDVTFTANGTTFTLAKLASASGWAEFDDLSVSIDGGIPLTMARSSVATLEKWEADDSNALLVLVGANWMRTSEFLDDQDVRNTGYRSEPGTTNKILHNGDFSNAAWTKSELTASLSTFGYMPGRQMSALVASSNNVHHYVEQQITQVAGVGHHTFTIYARAGIVSGLRVAYTQDATQWAYFDLENGVVGDVGSGLSAAHPTTIEYKGNGVYRCRVVYEAIGVNVKFQISPSDGVSDGDHIFAGNGVSNSVYIYGAQAEEDHHGAGSLIVTGAASASRSADSLVFPGLENLAPIVRNRVLLDAPDPHEDRYLFEISDGLGFDFVALYQGEEVENATLEVFDGGISQASLTTTGELGHHAWCEVEALWREDDFRAWLCKLPDASSDTSGTVPDSTNLDFIYIGKSNAGNELSGLVADFELSEYGLARPRCFLGLNDGAAEGAFLGYLPDVDDDTKVELFAGLAGDVAAFGGSLSVDEWHYVGVVWDGAYIEIWANGTREAQIADTTTMTSYDALSIGWAGVAGYDETDVATAWYAPGAACSLAEVRVRDAAASTYPFWLGMYEQDVPPYEEHLVHEISTEVVTVTGGNYGFLDVVGGLEGDAQSDSIEPERFATWAGVGVGASEFNEIENFLVDFGNSVEFLSNYDHTFMAWIRPDVEDGMIWCNDLTIEAPGDTAEVVDLAVAVSASSAVQTVGASQDGTVAAMLGQTYYNGAWHADHAWRAIARTGFAGEVVGQNASGEIKSIDNEGNITTWGTVQSVYNRGNVVIIDEANEMFYCPTALVETARKMTFAGVASNDGMNTAGAGFNCVDGCMHKGNAWVLINGNVSLHGGAYERTADATWTKQWVPPSGGLRMVSDGDNLYMSVSSGDILKWDGTTETNLGNPPGGGRQCDGLCVYNGDLYACSDSLAGGNDIYKYVSGTSWTAVTSGIGPHQDLIALGTEHGIMAINYVDDTSLRVFDDSAKGIQSLEVEGGDLIYRFKSNLTERELRTSIEKGKWTHVGVIREYDGSDTRIRLLKDGKTSNLETFAGSPSLANTHMYMFAEPADGANPFIGRAVAMKFFNDSLSAAEFEAYYNRQYNQILSGPYATQGIASPHANFDFSWYERADGVGGYPFVLIQEYAGAPWRPIRESEDLGDTAWSTWDDIRLEDMHGLRLYAKNYTQIGSFFAKFDDLDGGEDPGDAVITTVDIPRERAAVLEEIILRRKPLHSWAVLVVRYT